VTNELNTFKNENKKLRERVAELIDGISRQTSLTIEAEKANDERKNLKEKANDERKNLKEQVDKLSSGKPNLTLLMKNWKRRTREGKAWRLELGR
jgi:DNA-binding XRE family transcriptional regulator